MITGVRFSNGRKDKGFKYLIQLVPIRVDDAINELEDTIRKLKHWKKEIENSPEKYDQEKTEF